MFDVWGNRLYIKHHFRYPQVTQSVAITKVTDGLDIGLVVNRFHLCSQTLSRYLCFHTLSGMTHLDFGSFLELLKAVYNED